MVYYCPICKQKIKLTGISGVGNFYWCPHCQIDWRIEKVEEDERY